MSDSEPSKVFMFDASDPEFEMACEQARRHFVFWREIAWERRRIVPALDFACVKAPFADSDRSEDAEGSPAVEQMWLSEIDFDGQFVSGQLLNAPNWLKTVKQGDSAQLRLSEITDWMYAISGEVYGGYTVHQMRARMDKRERKDHDDAWGLNFGDPKTVRIVPQKKGWFGKAVTELEEHPMSVNMAASLEEALADNKALLTEKDERGWTTLHHESLAGSAATVEVLLRCGADPNAIATNDATPMQLAKALGWDKVVSLLASKGATK